MDILPNFFLVGSQKSATTWLHRCFREHPQIYVPDEDEIHFFDIHYDKGVEWYQLFYNGWAGEELIGDTTSSYMRDPFVPQRVAEHNPNSRFIFSFRNPIDRAFSHYWHEKKKRKIAFEFSEVFTNYDLYQSWVITGFYYEHLKRFLEHFSEEQILVMIYEDLISDPLTFIQNIFRFLNVDPDFHPAVLHEIVNKAWYRPTLVEKGMHGLYAIFLTPIKRLTPRLIRKYLNSEYLDLEKVPQIMSEYDNGMDNTLRAELLKIFRPENEKLSELIHRDLSFWV